MNKEMIEEMYKETTVRKSGRNGEQRRFYKGKRWPRVLWDLCNPDRPCKGYDIHHINGDKLDDRIENLARMTRSEHRRLHALNRSDETKKKISIANSGANHPKAKAVNIQGKIFSTGKEASEFLNVCPATITYRIRNFPGYSYVEDLLCQ